MSAAARAAALLTAARCDAHWVTNDPVRQCDLVLGTGERIRPNRSQRYLAIYTRLVNLCWSIFHGGLILAVIAALGAGIYLYFCLDDEIVRQAENRLAGHYRGLHVDVGRGDFEQDRGITLYDISLSEPFPNDTERSLLLIKELRLAGKMRMDELLAGQPAVERIAIRGATVRAARGLDGQWNVASLLPLPRFSDQCPEITIEDSTIVLTDATHVGQPSLTLHDVNLSLLPMSPDGQAANTGHYRVVGSVAGLPAREFCIEGDVGTRDGTMNLTFRLGALEITPELLAALPIAQPELLRSAEVIGRAEITLHIRRVATDAPILWTASVQVDRGRLAHKTLPEPLTDVSLTASADSNGLSISCLTGRYRAAEVTLACNRSGWAQNAPLTMSARIRGLSLDERLKAVLPRSLSNAWQRFRPAGTIDAAVRLTFDGHTWRPQVSAECRAMSLTDMEKFPYRLEQASGKVTYAPADSGRPDRLQLDLTGVGGGRPIRIMADLSDLVHAEIEGEPTASGLARIAPARRGVDETERRAAGYRGLQGRRTGASFTHHPLGSVVIAANSVPLHPQLIAALPEKGAALVRSLHAQGAIDFVFRAEWKNQLQPRADVSLDIQLKECSIRYEKFPYPLHHLNGQVTARNWHWLFHEDIQARGGSDSAIVQCRGQATPCEDGYDVELNFNADNVPLDDNLREALPPRVQQAWEELQPQGRVDLVARAARGSDLEGSGASPVIEITLQPRERNVSIQPRAFPYLFEQIDGVAKYEQGRITFSNLRARHGRIDLSAATGAWQPMQEGGWRLDLGGVDAYRLVPQRDRDLLMALPPTLQNLMDRLRPTGTYDVHNSQLSLAKSPQSERLASAWDVNLECFQAALPGAVPLESVSGGVRLTGRNDAQSSYAAAELDLDSLVWKGMQFTKVRGPVWIDRSFCLVGEAATRKLGQPPRRITAAAYGGSVALNAAMQHDINPHYAIDVMLGGAELTRFANERLDGPKDLGGTVSGKLLLSGMGRSVQTLSGSGELHVVDANIYQLPVLVRLLKVLRNRTPTTTAFNRCDMQFAIQGEHVSFQQLDLLGDAVSLYGKGETSLERDLNLVFYTLIGPADLPIPLWKTIAGRVSQQGLALKVVGRWDNPQVESEPLPAVNEVFQQMKAGAATMAPTTAVREVLVPPLK